MNYIDQDLPKAGDTVLVGMSGGVDSTLTALLLKQQGCNVIGVTMSLWDTHFPSIEHSGKEHCFDANESDSIDECRQFCKEYDIEYHVVNLQDEYRINVLDYFRSEYRAGRTPNPCIRCNTTMKFNAMLQSVCRMGIMYDYFCTGHYARIVRPEEGLRDTINKPYMVAQAADKRKDQTYFLYRVKSEILKKVRFPLAYLQKSDVFALAKKAHLKAANHKESQDFIDPKYFDLLFADDSYKEGDIVDLDGNLLGHHKGIEHYTIGQRKGLGIAMSYPLYVYSIDAKSNTIVLAPITALQVDHCIIEDVVWAGNIEPEGSVFASVKVRLASQPVDAVIERYMPKAEQSFVGQPWVVRFKVKQSAVAPGQSAVLYDDNVVIGGGIICKTQQYA